MQKNTKSRKLTLSTTTIRTLDAQKLEEVPGARRTLTFHNTCADIGCTA